MKTSPLTTLSDQELSKKLKGLKTTKLIDAALVGLTLGIVAYGAVNHGFSFFTFFPLIITYVVVKNANNNKLLEQEIQQELKTRG